MPFRGLSTKSKILKINQTGNQWKNRCNMIIFSGERNDASSSILYQLSLTHSTDRQADHTITNYSSPVFS